MFEITLFSFQLLFLLTPKSYSDFSQDFRIVILVKIIQILMLETQLYKISIWQKNCRIFFSNFNQYFWCIFILLFFYKSVVLYLYLYSDFYTIFLKNTLGEAFIIYFVQSWFSRSFYLRDIDVWSLNAKSSFHPVSILLIEVYVYFIERYFRSKHHSLFIRKLYRSWRTL